MSRFYNYPEAEELQNDDVFLIDGETDGTRKIPANKMADFFGEQVPTDKTLSIENKAADAKKTGDEISDLKSALTSKVDEDLMQKCELIDVPASANKWDNATAQVGYLHTNGNVYTGGNYDNYRYNSIGAVDEGDVITSWKVTSGTASGQTMQMVVAYDANGNVKSSLGASSVTSYTVPSGVALIKCTFSVGQLSDNVMVLINASGTPTEYIPYAEPYKYYIATNDFLPPTYDDGFVKIDGKNQVTAQNAEFMFHSPNLVDESTLIDGYYVNQVTGNLDANTAHTVTDWIEIEGGQSYTLSAVNDRSFRYCFYNSGKTYISGESTESTGEIALTAPSSAKYFRCSTTGFRSGYVQLQKGNKTPYSAYGDAYLLEEYAPRGKSAVINLPSKIYALSGYELNIYFENLTEDWERYSWNVDCSKGTQLQRGYRVTPTNADAGSYVLTFTATDATGMVTVASTTLIIKASTAGSGVTETLIVLGDSTTNNGIAVTKLAENFSDDVMDLTLYGTRGTAPYKHEGRSGWTFNHYFTLAVDSADSSVLNPFYNSSTQTFDASYYFSNSGVSVPDWFFINLGINDTFGYSTDASLAVGITNIKAMCDAMIESVQNVSSDIKIGIALTIPPNHSQDAFGKAYACSQTRDRYKRNNVIWVHDLIETYDGREAEGIYLVPIYTNLDTVYNMGMETLPVNARNTAVTYESPIGNGGVHPAESGYWQIADVYTAFLKANA